MKPLNLGTQTGSFFNHIYSHNAQGPVVDRGATVLHWTDRDAYEVHEVAENGKSAVIQKYKAKRLDKLGMSDSQAYEYKEFDGGKFTIYFKWGKWRTRGEVITFIDQVDFSNHQEFHRKYIEAGGEYIDCRMSKVIPGITKTKVEWHDIRIVFGIKQEYYDYSF